MNLSVSVSENIIMFVNKLSEATCHVIISTEDDRIHRGWPLFTTVFVRVGITFSDEFVNISWIMYFLLA